MNKTFLLLLSILYLTIFPASGEVMMQGFYWDLPAGGIWYEMMEAKAEELRYIKGEYGINRIWFPPPAKGMLGKDSMGYDICDYYDLGEYYQHNTVETRFGSREELQSAINTFHSYGISCMADIVLNHRSGAYGEYNPRTGEKGWTDFTHVASGKCLWNWKNFHPNDYCSGDCGTFGDPPFPDVCYRSGAYENIEEWLLWMRNDIGFDGWRFDYVKGVEYSVVKDLKEYTGNPFCIGEYWDGEAEKIDRWVELTGVTVFDFPLYYTLRDICNDPAGNAYLPDVFHKSYVSINPSKSVTFVANHDTERAWSEDKILTDKLLAYAFILTYEGYPCIFWGDYFNENLKEEISSLIWVREKLAGGSPEIKILKDDDGDIIIYEAEGKSDESPGYIVAINDHPMQWKGYWIQSNNNYLKGKKLKCCAWYSSVAGENIQPQERECDKEGCAEISAPPRGYVVYSYQHSAVSNQ